MAITTTMRNGAPRIKPFAWSYSRLKNFEVCPKRHYEIDLAKNIKEPEGEQLQWGNFVHKGMAERCGPNRVPLPEQLAMYEPWAVKALHGAERGIVLVEESLAISRNFTPTGNFDSDVWLRVKMDFAKIIGDVALALDWKTGKILEDSMQLALVAACLFAKYPNLNAVRSSYAWLKEDAESSETFFKEDMPTVWRNLWPRIEAMESAHTHTNYPPTPSGMCMRFCAVKACPHNGKSSR
jgi:hypothetical protein